MTYCICRYYHFTPADRRERMLLMFHVFHVAENGSDKGTGAVDQPFATIQHAAGLAEPGDRVVVHQGTYREWVRPRQGGWSENSRITFEAAPGERPIIKGSEQVSGWENVEGTVWKVTLPDSFFGSFNPYRAVLEGDWLVSPKDRALHPGEVYLNGKSFYEAAALEDVFQPKMRTVSEVDTWAGREEKIREPEQTVYQWFPVCGEDCVTIYANFQGADPNRELVEINVRKFCFFPERTGVDFITVRGFEMMHAATSWAPPTAVQEGLLGANWSKGWVIEDNVIHDSKCSGISIGKEVTTGNNECTKYHRKPGYQQQLEAVFRARGIGWSRERVGGHIVRNNVIYDCGQNGVVGHLGGVFSEIYGNDIFNIGVKYEFFGYEIAGIKLHAAIDAQIHSNYIHNCSLGIWLDWQAQGTRVSRNVFHENNRDLMIEVTHGPHLVDNNVFTADYSLVNAAQGGAFVRNLLCGFVDTYNVMNRATPYHWPHSTEVLGTALVYGGDDRWVQNVFVGGTEEGKFYGTAYYDGSPVSMEEYVQRVCSLGNGDVEQFEMVRQPVYIKENAYLNGAKHFDREAGAFVDEADPMVRIFEEDGAVYLELTVPEGICWSEEVSSDNLEPPRIVGERFETPDGADLRLGPPAELKPGKNRFLVWKRSIVR